MALVGDICSLERDKISAETDFRYGMMCLVQSSYIMMK